MNPKRDIKQTILEDPEVTTLGKFLRRYKFDEIPQIYNVIKGEMSLIGPRPILPFTYLSMPDWAKNRFNVKPGLTGLAQVRGNIFLSWEERWRYDCIYASNISLLRDCKILFKTIFIVIFGEKKFKVIK